MDGTPAVQPREVTHHRALPVEAARRLLRREAYTNLVRLLAKLHGSECAEILHHMPLSERSKLLERLPDTALATTMFTYLEEETRAALVPHLSTARLVAMVKLLPPDDATDILGEMPPDRLTEMLHQLPEALSVQIDRLLSYDPRTAGGLMTTQYFSLEDTCTVSEALQQLRTAGQAETVFYVYVVDSEHRLAGVVSLRQLVMADPDSRLRGLATGAVEPRRFLHALLREGRVGLSLGAIYGVLLGAVAYVWQGTPMLGLVVGSAICASMTVAAVLGGLLPLVFARIGVDPAVASGPFLTTAIDIIGLAMYLFAAQFFLLA